MPEGAEGLREGSGEIWLDSEARSELESKEKLLLVEGALEEGLGFLPVTEGFLLCFLREGTLGKPSCSDLSSTSLF